MKTIKINFEYNAFPVWIYDENGNLEANDLPDYLLQNEELDLVFTTLQIEFNSLFNDTEKEFSYVGFKNPSDEKSFQERTEIAKNMLKSLLTEEYKIE